MDEFGRKVLNFWICPSTDRRIAELNLECGHKQIAFLKQNTNMGPIIPEVFHCDWCQFKEELRAEFCSDGTPSDREQGK